MGHQTDPTFSALANELIVNIAGSAKLRDVLSLRQTCRKMANNCRRAMKKRNLTLYLHPLRVQDAIKICHLDVFRNSITEVALLGKSTRTLRPHDFSEGFDNFHPWPLSEEMGDLHQFHLEDPLAYSKHHHPRKWMPTCYAGLLSALGKLPGLTILSYGSKAIQEGLCSSARNTIDAHAWETDPWHLWHADTLGQSGPKSGVDFLDSGQTLSSSWAYSRPDAHLSPRSSCTNHCPRDPVFDGLGSTIDGHQKLTVNEDSEGITRREPFGRVA